MATLDEMMNLMDQAEADERAAAAAAKALAAAALPPAPQIYDQALGAMRPQTKKEIKVAADAEAYANASDEEKVFFDAKRELAVQKKLLNAAAAVLKKKAGAVSNYAGVKISFREKYDDTVDNDEQIKMVKSYRKALSKLYGAESREDFELRIDAEHTAAVAAHDTALDVFNGWKTENAERLVKKTKTTKKRKASLELVGEKDGIKLFKGNYGGKDLVLIERVD